MGSKPQGPKTELPIQSPPDIHGRPLPRRRIWDRSRVIEGLKGLGGYPTSSQASKADRSLVIYAYKFFGTWSNALKAASIDDPNQHWTRREVNEVLYALKARDGYVDTRNLLAYKRDGYPGFFKVVYRMFKSIRAIQRFLQLSIRRKLDREDVLREILKRKRLGIALSLLKIQESSKGLYNAARRHFGSWENAITACNLNYDQVRRQRRWTERSVLLVIREHWQQGRDLRAKATHQRDGALVCTAKRFFGSWELARWAAGALQE